VTGHFEGLFILVLWMRVLIRWYTSVLEIQISDTLISC
jgi:hypothetical protein